MKLPTKILLVDDDELIVATLTRILKSEGYDVRAETTPDRVESIVRSWSPAVVLLDVRLPGRSGIEVLEDIVRGEGRPPVVMLTADDTAESAVKAMKLGAADYLTKPFNIDEVKIVLRNIVERERLRQEVDYLRMVNSQLFERTLIGDSDAIRQLKAQLEKMAQASVSTILITGESGTGKELVARQLHLLLHGQTPQHAPFIRVNCAALPDTLLESELFGYKKGAFTDAKADKKGLFEMAQGGSILLDEIGEMKLTLQSKLLRVLEERTVRHIGGSAEIPIDATVISTTNRDLAAMVQQGEFRMDLFYRLNAFSLHIPPLRERPDDISALSNYYLTFFSTKYAKSPTPVFSPEAEALIRAHRWTGNVRELKNVIERLVVLGTGDRILPEHLPKEIVEGQAPPARSDGQQYAFPDGGMSLEAMEKEMIRQALERTNRNKAKAARLLGISYDTLRYQVKKFGLE